MANQIKLLTGIMLCDFCGWNEFLHTKDEKKKRQFYLMAVVWGILLVMLFSYMGMASNALVKLGLGEVIPSYLYAITSLVILFFSFFKASSIIFQLNTFEMQISLPVSKTAIIISRFLTMYLSNLAISGLVMVTGMMIYGIHLKPSTSFYIAYLLGILCLPLIPITIATIAGAMITAISSRMKHKSLIGAALSILFFVFIMILNVQFSSNANHITEQMIRELSQGVQQQIYNLYPPAIWFSRACVNKSVPTMVLLIGSSVFVFLIMVLVLQRYFTRICQALLSTSAKSNYKMHSLSTSSPIIALCKREIKRYFASSIYVTNTIVGYVMMVGAPIAILIMGVDKVEASLQISNRLAGIMPLVLSATAVIMPITSCSISMEGKQWWIAQTLPISSKQIFDGKILANLVIAAPFYAIAVIVSCIACRVTLLQAIWMVVIPALFIVYSAVLGITINRHVPLMEWDNETRVVKQSASTMLTMLASMASVIVSIVACFVFRKLSTDGVMLGISVTLCVLIGILYIKNNKASILTDK